MNRIQARRAITGLWAIALWTVLLGAGPTGDAFTSGAGDAVSAQTCATKQPRKAHRTARPPAARTAKVKAARAARAKSTRNKATRGNGTRGKARAARKSIHSGHRRNHRQRGSIAPERDGSFADGTTEAPLAPVVPLDPRNRPVTPPIDEATLTTAQREYLQWGNALLNSLQFVKGDIPIANGVATLHVGDGYEFLGPLDTAQVLTKVWGNPPGTAALGMIVPATASPFDAGTWGIVLRYVGIGHVVNGAAGATATVNFATLLPAAQAAIRAQNATRVAGGFPPVELLNWITPPVYLPAQHAIHWCKALRFAAAPQPTLNCQMRLLGRRGVLELDFVGTAQQFASVQPQLLALLDFNPGHRYMDFDARTDPVAAGGLATLVTGTVPAPPAPPGTRVAAWPTFFGRPLWLALPLPLGVAFVALWHWRSLRAARAQAGRYAPATPPAVDEA